MMGRQLKSGREQKGWSQEYAASQLGVSQPYLSMLERDERRVPEQLARKAVGLYRMSAAVLPTTLTWDSVWPTDGDTLALDLAALGYPGLSYLKPRRKRNPAEVLISALSAGDLDVRLTEALPWVLLKFPDLDWRWLVAAAKLNDLQNRLGFVTSVARRLAEMSGDKDMATLLGQQEAVLERSRLMREDTLCHDSLTEPERRWLRENRPAEAKHWGLLTDMSPEHLNHAA
jgi:transcriptional regulator with XRE-family HTH domain